MTHNIMINNIVHTIYEPTTKKTNENKDNKAKEKKKILYGLLSKLFYTVLSMVIYHDVIIVYLELAVKHKF